MITRRAFVVGAAGLTGCGASLATFPFDAGGGPAGPLGLELRFFSVTCALLRVGDISVLVDPFFTHAPFPRVALGRLGPDPAAVAPHLDQLGDTRAVLVGHSHYDHVMGLSAVDPALHPDAEILGTRTLRHVYAAAELTHPIVPLDGWAATPTRAGTWWRHSSGRLRILPIASGHPTQYLFFHLFKRSLLRDARHAPRRAADWQEGPTLAFLIDFLDEDGITARVYVETSSRGYPDGFFPRSLLAERGVDLAIVSMDVANREMASGDSVLHLVDPPIVAFNHYEDFFSPKDEPPREIVKVDLPETKAFFEARGDRRYLFPAWDSVFRF